MPHGYVIALTDDDLRLEPGEYTFSEHESPYADTERAIWKVLGTRRWFGKHVDEDEMEQLEVDLSEAIHAALETWVS